MFSVTWLPARGLISAPQRDYPGRLPGLCSELFSSQGLAFFSLLRPSAKHAVVTMAVERKVKKKKKKHTHKKVERHAFIQMRSLAEGKAVTLPSGACRKRKTLHRGWGEMGLPSTLWAGGAGSQASLLFSPSPPEALWTVQRQAENYHAFHWLWVCGSERCRARSMACEREETGKAEVDGDT